MRVVIQEPQEGIAQDLHLPGGPMAGVNAHGVVRGGQQRAVAVGQLLYVVALRVLEHVLL